MSPQLSLALQYIVIALAVAVSAWVVLKKQFPDAVRRLRILEPATSADAYAKRYLATVDPVSSAPLIAAFRKVWDETPTE